MSVAAGITGLAIAGIMIVSTIRPYRGQGPVIVAVMLVLLALCAVSYVNVYVVALPGGEADAKLFNKYAVELLRHDNWPDVSIGTQAYLWILTSFYSVFESDPNLRQYLLVGQCLSIVAASGTLVFIDRIAVNLGIQRVYWRASVLLVSGLLPVFLLHNALTLREPYQLLGLAMGVYFTLKAVEERRMFWLCCAAAGFLFMGVFHHVLLGLSFVLIGLAVLVSFGRRTASRCGYSTAAILVISVGVLGYIVLTVVPATKGNDYVKDIWLEGGVMEAIENYRGEVESESPRTSYSVSMDSGSPIATAKALTLNYWLYLSAPLGRAPDRAADLVPIASSGIRVVMLGFVAWSLLFGGCVNRKVLFCALTYLLVTAVWSLGTTNYGQAFRHHVLSDWLLVVMCVYAWRFGRNKESTEVQSEYA